MAAPTIRARIVELLTEAEGSPVSGQRSHVLGVVRGLVWSLTGEDPGVARLRKTGEILSIAGIPYAFDGPNVFIPGEWLDEHGLEANDVF